MENKKYETFWPRFAALLVDAILLLVLLYAIEVLIGKYAYINNLVSYTYYVFMVGRYGQTVGKMVVKIKVVDYKTENPVDYNQSFRRVAVPFFLMIFSILIEKLLWSDNQLTPLEKVISYLPDAMLFIWAIIEIVTMLNDSKSMAMHDKIADTVVIRMT